MSIRSNLSLGLPVLGAYCLRHSIEAEVDGHRHDYGYRDAPKQGRRIYPLPSCRDCCIVEQSHRPQQQDVCHTPVDPDHNFENNHA